MIATDEDTGPLTLALVKVEPGKNLLAFRELITLQEFVTVWGRVNSVETKYEVTGPEEIWVDIPELRQDIEECADYIGEFGFDGGDPTVVHPKDVSIIFFSPPFCTTHAPATTATDNDDDADDPSSVFPSICLLWRIGSRNKIGVHCCRRPGCSQPKCLVLFQNEVTDRYQRPQIKIV